MPSSKNYKEVKKFCEVCGESLTLNSSRDLERKRYCSVSCRAKAQWASREETLKACIKCDKQFSTKVKNQVYCSPECSSSDQVSRSYKMVHNRPEKYFQHLLYKKGREQLSVEFMLELLDKQNGLCAISGVPLTFIKIPGQGRVNTNASVDQIIAGGGYAEDNVQLVCDVVNRMKIDMTEKELKFWCRAILED